MKELNEDQINKIHDLLIDIGLSHTSVIDDVLDHLACIIEEKMWGGKSFESATKEALFLFSEQEIMQTEEEIIYELTKKSRIMKKWTGIIGMIASVLIMLGVWFKVNHWLGAGVMLVTGLLMAIILAFPGMSIVDYKKDSSTIQKLTIITGYVSAILLSLTTLFKVMHWPGFYMFYTPGIILLLFVFIPLHMWKSYKTSENKIYSMSKTLLVLAGICIFLGLVFR
jgi:cation transport ATPase